MLWLVALGATLAVGSIVAGSDDDDDAVFGTEDGDETGGMDTGGTDGSGPVIPGNEGGSPAPPRTAVIPALTETATVRTGMAMDQAPPGMASSITSKAKMMSLTEPRATIRPMAVTAMMR